TPHPRPILNRAAAPVIPTLPLHDALPICRPRDGAAPWPALRATPAYCRPNCATAPGNAADDRPAAAAPAPALPTPAAGPPPDRPAARTEHNRFRRRAYRVWPGPARWRPSAAAALAIPRRPRRGIRRAGPAGLPNADRRRPGPGRPRPPRESVATVGAGNPARPAGRGAARHRSAGPPGR